MSTYYAGIRSTLQIRRAEYKKQIIIDNKDIQIPSKDNRFIILYHFRATCFDSLESSSGPLMN